MNLALAQLERFLAEPANLDFTAGNNRWGHALHSDTFAPAPRCGRIARWTDRRAGVRRYTVLVHTDGAVRPGLLIRWTASEGRCVEGVVTDVKCLRDPPDMYRLTIKVGGK